MGLLSNSELLTIAARMLAAGALVCVFALIGELARPKQVAGIFSAAPSIALASLFVLLVAGRRAELQSELRAMAAGAVAFVAASTAGALAIRRVGAVAGSVIEIAIWLLFAAGIWLVWLR